MESVYLLLGSNEGDRRAWLRQAREALRQECGALIAHSALYETAAWGLTNQPSFLNQAVHLTTPDEPQLLLSRIQAIEARLGRQRNVRWGQRTLDIDILLFGNRIINEVNLSVPHPHMPVRRFALTPLCEIAPGLTHPVLKKTIQELLDECPDKLPAERTDG